MVETATHERSALRRRGQIYMAGAAMAWSLAGVMQRGLDVSTATQMAGRAFFASVSLIIVTVLEARRRNLMLSKFVSSIGWVGTAIAVCFATASAIVICGKSEEVKARVTRAAGGDAAQPTHPDRNRNHGYRHHHVAGRCHAVRQWRSHPPDLE